MAMVLFGLLPILGYTMFFSLLARGRVELAPIRTFFGTPKAMREMRGHDYVWVFTLDDAAASRLGGVLDFGHRLFEVGERGGRVDLRPVQ
jgi:hypothetical protein